MSCIAFQIKNYRGKSLEYLEGVITAASEELAIVNHYFQNDKVELMRKLIELEAHYDLDKCRLENTLTVDRTVLATIPIEE